MIKITDSISISEDELTERFTRSGGPGGQNVNKVSTAVTLRFDALNSPNLPEPVRARLLVYAGQKATNDGVIIIDAQRFRTRELNRKDAFDRLAELIRKAARPPKPRKKTRPTLASRERKLNEKKARAKTKVSRKPVGREDY